MKLYIEDNQNIPSIQILPDTDPTPTGYTEKTSIEDWHKYGRRSLGEFVGHNYLTWRRKIQSLILAIVAPDYSNWNGLTTVDKEIAAEMILAPYSLRTTIVNDEQDIENWTSLIIQSQGKPVDDYRGRVQIIEKMREAVGNELRVETMSKNDVDTFYANTQTLLSEFIASNSPKLKQWLTNEPGTPYENNGFAQEPYYSQEREDYLIAVYAGNY